MAVIFYYTLEYAKEIIFGSFTELLNAVLAGENPDPTLLDNTIDQVDQVSLFVLAGMLAFSLFTAIIAARITLRPTRKALSMQKRFISAVAHELRTPLSVLRTNNEVALYDVPVDSPARATIEENITESKHLTNVLNNLIIFSRIDTQESIPFEPVDLSAAVKTVMTKLNKLSDRRNIHITSNLSPGMIAEGNQTAIEQVLFNVIKNAIKYSQPKGGSVHIETFSENRTTVTVRVTDDGIGISKKDLPHIFSPFYRVDTSRTLSDSMGLGLSLVYEIMKMHNGHIDVQSTPNKGSVFTLMFRSPVSSINKPAEPHRHKDRVAYDFA